MRRLFLSLLSPFTPEKFEAVTMFPTPRESISPTALCHPSSWLLNWYILAKVVVSRNNQELSFQHVGSFDLLDRHQRHEIEQKRRLESSVWARGRVLSLGAQTAKAAACCMLRQSNRLKPFGKSVYGLGFAWQRWLMPLSNSRLLGSSKVYL